MATEGKSTALKLDEASASLTDISAKLTSVDFPEAIAALKTTTFGENSETYILGLKNATFSISGIWDATIELHLRGIYGHATSKTFEYGPAGSTAGLTKLTGECWLTSYRRSNPVDGVVTFTADFQCTDDVTASTF